MGEAAAARLRFVIEWNGKFQDFNVRVGEAVSIGRAPGSGVLIEDSCVSSQHVELHAQRKPDGGKLCLWGRDMSRNGTGILEDSGVCRGEPDVQKLRSDRAEELCHGVELIVPLTRSQSKEEKPRARLLVHLLEADKPLPAPSDRVHTESAIAIACTRVARLARQPAAAAVLAAAGMSASNGFPADDPHSVAAFALSAETPCLPPGGVKLMPRPVARGSTTQAADGQPQNGGLDAAGLPDAYNPVTGTGRWRYENRLGEGGLGVVYRATDRKGSLGEVAVKVLKRNSRFPKRDARHAFAMHRESQWSIRWIHNQLDTRYREEPSALFARYLEDHTGFSELGPESFEEKRRRYEAPDFDWDIDGPDLPPHPYVVMEYVKGEALQVAIDRERKPIVEGVQEPPALSSAEKRAVVVQATLALEYLCLFSLIHRDFRGCNMHLVSRSGEESPCTLKVLDLGVMICGEDGQESNSNSAVQAFRRRGATEEKRRRYDWLPWEVRDGADGKGPAVNFCRPPHSFDVFSLGVLILHLLVGKTEARAILDTVHSDARIANPAPLGIDVRLLQRMLSREATERPHPGDLLDALERRGFLTKRTPLFPREDETCAEAVIEEQARSARPPAPHEDDEPTCSVKDVEMPERPVIAQPRAGGQVTVLSSSPTRLSNVGSRSRSRSSHRKKASKGAGLPAKSDHDRSKSRSRERKQQERRDKWGKATVKVDEGKKAEEEAQEKARAIARAHAEACAKAEEFRRAEAQFYEAQQLAKAQAKAEAEAKAKQFADAAAAAERARSEAESKRVQAAAEERARAEAEAARDKAEAEERARAEAEAARVKAEAEKRARAEAERAQAAERARAEAEAREKAARAEADAKARAEADAKARQLRAEEEVEAKTKAEAAAVMERLRSEAEAKSKADHTRAQGQLGKGTNGKSEIYIDERARIVGAIDRSLEEVHTPVEDPSPPREVAPSAPKASVGDVCHSCGAKFVDNAPFCRQCGAKREWSTSRFEDVPPVACNSRPSETPTSRSEDKPVGRPSRFSDGPSVTPTSGARYEDNAPVGRTSRFSDGPSGMPTSRSEEKPSAARKSRWSDEPSVSRSEEKPSVAPSRFEDRPSRFEDNRSVAVPSSRFDDKPPVPPRSGALPPPPPPPTRSARPQQTPPPPPPGLPPPPAATPSSTPNGVPPPPAGTSSSTPNGAWPSATNELNPYASATPKSKGPEAAFPTTNVCFPPGLNFGASPPTQQASMMQNFQMPTPPAMMGMPSVALPGQQLPAHLQQAWNSQQQMAAGFMPNFGSAAPSWNAFQAFQPAVQQHSAEETIVGTTRCIRPPRASANGHRPY